jgi:hypothetical protein
MFHQGDKEAVGRYGCGCSTLRRNSVSGFSEQITYRESQPREVWSVPLTLGRFAT